MPDELEAFRKRMFQLMGKIGDPSEVETTSALRKWFKKVLLRRPLRHSSCPPRV